MTQLTNAMEIFKVLPRTNCKACRVPTCFAFAAAVFKGDQRLEECPHVDRAALETLSVENSDSRTLEREEQQALAELRQQIANMDLASSAERLGASFSGDKLSIRVLGKDFHVDSQGIITSECHIHGWITVPILNYVISSAGSPFQETGSAARAAEWAVWAPLFGQRCEKPLKRVADLHTPICLST